MEKLFTILTIGIMMGACAPEKPTEKTEEASEYENTEQPKKEDDGKGIGQIREVTLNVPLETERIGRGKAVYEMKCSACHWATL